MTLRTALDSLTAVLFPAPYRICHATLLTASRIPICGECFASFEPIRQPMCARGGRPFFAASAAESAWPICRLCRDNYYAFDFARSYGVYNDALHCAIPLLKYEEVTRLGDWFAAQLAALLAREPEVGGADVLVPVPLHPDRERGYNQAELIARPLARRLHLKSVPTCWCVPSLARRDWGSPARSPGTVYVPPTLRARVCGLTSFAFYW